VTFGLWDYGPSGWVLKVFENSLPGARPRYLQSRQARDALPDEFSTTAQQWMVIAAIVLIAILTPIAWRRLSSRLVGLSAVVVFILIANAFITGVLSNVEDRYQSRVIWLLPLLAGLRLLEWLERRPALTFSKSAPEKHELLAQS
jgi:hypothetical protein